MVWALQDTLTGRVIERQTFAGLPVRNDLPFESPEAFRFVSRHLGSHGYGSRSDSREADCVD